MMRELALASVVLGAVVSLAGCKGSAEKTEKTGTSLSHEVTTISDRELLQNANAAAGEVIRNSTDCSKVVEAAPQAQAAIDEASTKVQSAAGKMAVDSLKRQVAAIVESCPSGGQN